MQLLRLIILLFCVSLLPNVLCDNGVTEEPISYRTGKLNQFKGFATPRPIPANAQFMYASVWASWSAWSFCVNNMQVRVRACNTVRGFSCLGTNQEHKACDHPQTSVNNRQEASLGDYDAVDPYEDDRKEAIRQLYSDYVPEVTRRPVKKARARVPVNFAAARGPGKPVNGPLSPRPMTYGGPQGPPIHHRQHGAQQHHRGPPRAPSMTPELLFGSKLEPNSNHSHPPPPPPEGLTHFAGNETTNQEKVEPSKASSEEQPHPPTTHDDRSSEQTTRSSSPIPETTAEVRTETPTPTESSSTTTSSTTTTTEEPKKFEGHPVMSIIEESEEKTSTTTTTTTKAPETTTITTTVNPPSTVKPQKAVPMPKEPTEDVIEHTATVVKHLHSGEVNLEDKRILTSDTARALSWMLANMTKTAEDYEYDDEQQQKAKNSVQEEEKLHSGEVVYPVLKANRNDKYKIKPETDFKRRVFAEKIHQTFEEMFTRTTESAPAWNEQLVELGAPLKSFPITQESNVRRAPPPSTPIRHVELAQPHQVKQIIHEKSPLERINSPTRVELVQAIEGFKQDENEKEEEQDALKQEIDKLRSLMHDMESQIERIKKEEREPFEKTKHEKPIESKVSVVEVDQKSQITKDAREKAINLDLVPHGPRTKSEPLPSIISKSEANDFFVRAAEQTNGDAHWSEWNPWNECFCDKQVRTRVCHYDDAFHSKGCQGRSYETRACTGTRPCPAHQVKKVTQHHGTEEATTPEYYTLAPPPRRRNGYAFRPNPLSVAINRIGSR